MAETEANEVKVGFRIKREYYNLYKIVLAERERSLKEDINEHIKQQVDGYSLLENDVTEKVPAEYSQLTFYIDGLLYEQYKKTLLYHNTKTTADLRRYILNVISENRELIDNFKKEIEG